MDRRVTWGEPAYTEIHIKTQGDVIADGQEVEDRFALHFICDDDLVIEGSKHDLQLLLVNALNALNEIEG